MTIGSGTCGSCARIVRPRSRHIADARTSVSGVSALLFTGSATARAADGGALPARAGTADEARDYALREAESPAVLEFVGGHGGGFAVALLVIGILVLAFLYLSKEGKI